MAISDTANDAIRFFCLNLRFGLADDGPDSWPHRKQCYPPLLRSHPSDFYGFQEANDFQITYLQELLVDYDMIGRRTPAPDHWQHNIIFYHRRWECTKRDHFYLSRTPDVPSKFTRSRWPRQCTVGVFQKSEMGITVINTHFDFEPEVQQKSAEVILERVDQITPRATAVLMGDLNAGPDASCIATFTSQVAGFKSALPQTSGGTHHGFSGVAKGPNIDWILYRGNVERDGAAIVTSQYNSRYPSDHFPLIATFKSVTSQ